MKGEGREGGHTIRRHGIGSCIYQRRGPRSLQGTWKRFLGMSCRRRHQNRVRRGLSIAVGCRFVGGIAQFGWFVLGSRSRLLGDGRPRIC